MDSPTISISEIGYNRQYVKLYMAGIIPVNYEDDRNFNMPWHNSLMPIGKDLLMVERAVLEAAYAGCNTVWIVCPEDIEPLIMTRIGDWVKSKNGSSVPVYYISVDSSQDSQKKTLTYSLLYGMLISYWIARKMSLWTIPLKFYISFPQAVYPCEGIKKFRSIIRREENSFFLSHRDKTIADGQLCGFSLSHNEFLAFWRNWREVAFKRKVNNNIMPIKLKEVFRFKELKFKPPRTVLLELPVCYVVEDWNSYMEALVGIKDYDIKRDYGVFRTETFRHYVEENAKPANLYFPTKKRK